MPRRLLATVRFFEANVRKVIEAHREAARHHLEVNEFAGMTPGEFRRLNGYKQPPSRELPTLGVHKYNGAPLPDSVDWSENGAKGSVGLRIQFCGV